MPKYSNGGRIDFTVGYNVDQSSLNKVKQSFQAIYDIKPGTNFKVTDEQLRLIQNDARKVEAALKQAFNVKLGNINMLQFNTSIKSSVGSLDQFYNKMSQLGAVGQRAFGTMSTEILTTKTRLQQTQGILSQMGTTMMNTVKWGIASRVFNGITQSVQQAFTYVKSLDSALTDIRIVTGQSRELMASFAEQANRAAMALGKSTMDYTKAALTFYQQGLSDLDVQARTQATLMAQNITGAGSLMADYLTAVWNGYKVANEEAELYVDKLAVVADSSASNMSLLATAMSKVAATANALGVPVDKLNAQIATIVATTRQAPLSVGNALKTIYARINDIRTGSDEAEVSLGNYSEQMASLGFNVLDASGNLRDTGDVIDLIGAKWSELSREQQIYLARTMAGQRQYNNLIALFDNWGKYTDLVNVSMNAQGTTMEKNSRYMESLEAHLNQLGAAQERLKSALIDSDSFKGLVDIGTNVVKLFANFILSIGGGGNALLMFGSIATQVFSGIVAKLIGGMINSHRANLAIQEEVRQKEAEVAEQRKTAAYENNEAYRNYVDNLSTLHQSWSVLSQSEKDEQQQRATRIRLIEDLIKVINELIEAANKLATALQGHKTDVSQGITLGLKENVAQIRKESLEVERALQDVNSAIEYSEGMSKAGKGSKAHFFTESYLNTKSLMSDADKAQYKEDVLYVQKEVNALLTTFKSFASATNFDYDNSGLSKIFDKIRQGFSLTEEESNQFYNTIKNHVQNVQIDASHILNADGLINEKNKIENLLTKLSADFQRINEETKTIFNVKQALGFVSSLGQVASGIRSITNLTKIWKNLNLSTGEKVLQTFTSISMGITMLVSGWSKAVSGFKTFSDALKLGREQLQIYQKAVKITRNVTQRLQQINEMLAIEKKIHDAEMAASEGTYTAEQIAFTEARIKKLEEEQAVLSGNMSFFGKLAKALTNPAVIAGVALTALLVGLMAYFDWMRNAARRAAELAQENAKKAQDAYNKVNESLHNLRDGLKSLKEEQDAFSLLAKGTQEWYEKLLSVNSKVMELIEKFPELRKYLTSEDGVLGFEEGYEELIIKLYQDRLANQTLEVVAAQRDATAKSNRADVVDLANLTRGLDEDAITRIIKEVNNDSSLKANTDALALVAGLNKNEIAAYEANKKLILNLADKVQENTAATEKSTDALLDSALSQTSEEYQNTRDDLKGAYRELYNSYANQAVLDELKYSSNDAVQRGQQGNTRGLDWDKLAARYAEINGLEEENVRVKGNYIQVLNEQGLWENDRTKDYVKNMIARADAEEQNNKAVDLFIKKAYSAFNGDVLSVNLAEKIATGLDFDKIDFTGFSSLALQKFLTKLSPLIIKVLGYSEEDLESLLQQQAKKNKQKVQNYINDLSLEYIQAFYKIVDQDSLEQLSEQGAQQLVDFITKAVTKGGELGYNQLELIFLGMNASLIEAYMAAYLEAGGSQEKFVLILRDQGIPVTEKTTEKFYALYKLLGLIDKDLSLEKTTKLIKGLIKDLKNGTEIDDLSYNKLKTWADKFGLVLDDLFLHTDEGMHRFIGDADTFTSTVETLLKRPFKDDLLDLYNQRQTLENIQASGKRVLQGLGVSSKVSRDTQLDFLEFTGQVDQQTLNSYRLANAQGTLDVTKQKLINDLVKQYIDYYDQIPLKILSINLKEEKRKEQLASTADTISDLILLYSQNEISGLAFGKALEGVSQQEMSNLGFDVLQYEAYVKLLQDSSEEYKNNLLAARLMAKLELRVSKGTEDLIKNFEDWNETLANGNYELISSKWKDMRETLANLFNTSEESIDLLGPDFVQKHWDKITDVKNGVEGAYEDLVNIANQELLIDISPKWDSWDQIPQLYRDLLTTLQDMADTSPVGVAINVDSDEALAKLNDFVTAAGMSSQQAIAYFKNLGYDIEVEEDPAQTVPQDADTWFYKPPVYGHDTTIISAGPFGTPIPFFFPTLEQEGLYVKASGKVADFKPGTYAIKTITPNGKGFGGNISRKQVASSPTNRRKSGGGGGGSSKAPKTEKPTKLTKDTKANIDPYKQINALIKTQSSLLSELQKKDKNLVPRDRLKNLQLQNKAIEEQRKLLQKAIGVADTERRKALLAINANFTDKGLGSAIWDEENSTIANYNDLLQNATDTYNKTIADAENAYNNWILDVYNKASAAQQLQLDKEKLTRKDNLDSAKETAKELYDAQKEALKNGLDALKNQKEYQKQLNELLEQLIELRIEASKVKVDASIDFGNFEREWLDFNNKFIKRLAKDSIVDNAKAAVDELNTYLSSHEIDFLGQQVDKYRRELQIIDAGGTSAIFGAGEDARGKAYKELQDYMKKYKDSLEKMRDLQELVQLAYINALDLAKDKFDEHIEQYERLSDLIEHNVKLTLLLYGEQAYATLDKYYKYQEQINANRLAELARLQGYWKSMMDNASSDEAFEAAAKHFYDVTDLINSALEDSIEHIAKTFENQLSLAAQRVNNKLSNGLGMDFLDQQWDALNNYDEEFLDNINSNFAITDVTNAYQQAIDDAAGNATQQQRLNKLMNDQLKILKEKDRLTEYDVERAKSLLDIEKQRMLLEDARNNKTKMRLRRDNQGNYTYQYVADEQNLAQLQLQLAQAENDLYNKDKENYRDNLNKLLDTYKDFQEEYILLTKQAAETEDEVLKEQLLRRRGLLVLSMNLMIEGFSEENLYSLGYLAQSTGTTPGFSIDLSEENLEKLAAQVPLVSSAYQDLADKLGEQGLLGTAKEFMDLTEKAVGSYQTNIQNTLATTGKTLEGIANASDTAFTNMVNSISTYMDKTGEAAIKAKEDILEVANALNTVNDILNDSFIMTNAQKYAEATNQALTEALVKEGEKNNFKKVGNNLAKGNSDAGTTGNQKLAAPSVAFATVDTSTATEAAKAITTSTEDMMTSYINGIQKMTSLIGKDFSSIVNGSIQAQTLNQNVTITAQFPNATSTAEIEQAFKNLVNIASQKASQFGS